MSIRDVAAKAGVSLGTVSKAFDDNAKVSPHTRERIRLAATELGYHPSAVARAMVRKRMDTVGVIFPPNFAAPSRPAFYSTIFDALLEAAMIRHKDISLCTGRLWVDATTSLSRFRDGRCDGFITFWQPAGSDLIPALLDADVPVVLLNDRGSDPRLSYVDIDSVASAHAMTRHLLDLGHRRIALLCGDKPVSTVVPREEGYRAALEEASVAYDSALNLPGTFEPRSIESRIDTLLDLPPAQRPTALFCTTDSIALVALRVLRQKNLRVPEDISVAGHDDLPGVALEHPALTTMRQPFGTIAGHALDLLVSQERDISARGTQLLLPAELVVRASTAPPLITTSLKATAPLHSENKEVNE
ncbi:MAG: LacI family DNA-binding transcriptional regulator [Armatimonadota bacterium]